ncbi:MAG: hypothetical protein OQJ77_02360, partial [Thiovulaceae bacterium]|nr:hypothetical protein [Sulfurimonadaceae bacterium]
TVKKFGEEHLNIDKKISSSVKIPPKKYNIFENDDLNDIIKINDDLQDTMYRCKQMGLTKEILIALRSSIAMFCLNIKYYKQISKFSKIIDSFSILLMRNSDRFLNLKKDEILLIDKLVHNIDIWLDKLFISGGEDLYFLDKTMKNDFLLLKQLIIPTR